MALRDKYTISLKNGKTHTIAVSKQGGNVMHTEIDGLWQFTESTKSGLVVSQMWVAETEIETVVFTPGG